MQSPKKIFTKSNIFESIWGDDFLCDDNTVNVHMSHIRNKLSKANSAEDTRIIPISYKIDHWSRIYIDQLSNNHDIKSVFGYKDLNTNITVEDFQNFIKLTIDKQYSKTPDSMTRESIVYELTKIWAEKTGQDLDQIPTIKMIIYPDTDKIDAKYNHGITVAYMKDIAKGRDTGIFDAKSNVTYGEAATLVANTEKAIKNELKSDDKPIVAGKFETKGRYEIKDDKVIFDFELMNHYTEAKELQFGSGHQFDLVISNENGEEVYNYSDGKFFTLALIFKTLEPGESIKWQDQWDMTNKKGEELKSGEYKAEIRVMATEKDGDEKIEESQLTTVIDFSL